MQTLSNALRRATCLFLILSATLLLTSCGAGVITSLLGSGGGGGGGSSPTAESTVQQALSHGMSIEPQGTTLSVPMTVEMPYTAEDLTELSIEDPEQLVVLLQGQPALLVVAGTAAGAARSTVLDIRTRPARILRPGRIGRPELAAVLGPGGLAPGPPPD